MTWTIFENEGVADLNALLTFGVSAKETANPVGYFGTGFKYAIAILLRTGHRVFIDVGQGKEPVEFTRKPVTIRGERFNLIKLGRRQLGFTDQVGKNWELWMAYRELFCNAKDEPGGRVFTASKIPASSAGIVRMLVLGDDLAGVFANHADYFLQSTPLVRFDNVELHAGASRYLYYRGVRAGAIPYGTRSKYTYNMLDDVSLTEDRTIHNPGALRYTIGKELATKLDDENILEKLLLRDRDTPTFDDVLDWHWNETSTAFRNVVGRIVLSNQVHLVDSAIAWFKTQRISVDRVPRAILSPARVLRLQEATNLATLAGFPLEPDDVTVTESLGPGILGAVHGGEIYLSVAALDDGVGIAAGTLIEEYLHAKCMLEDYTRAFQDRLLRAIVNLVQYGSQQEPKPVPASQEFHIITMMAPTVPEPLDLHALPRLPSDDDIPF